MSIATRGGPSPVLPAGRTGGTPVPPRMTTSACPPGPATPPGSGRAPGTATRAAVASSIKVLCNGTGCCVVAQGHVAGQQPSPAPCTSPLPAPSPPGPQSWALQGQLLPPGGPLPATQGHQPSCRLRGAGARRLRLPASSARRQGHPVPELPDPGSSTEQHSTARPALRQRGPAASPPASHGCSLCWAFPGCSWQLPDPRAAPGAGMGLRCPWELSLLGARWGHRGQRAPAPFLSPGWFPAYVIFLRI